MGKDLITVSSIINGKYRLNKLIDTGGMGEVYQATHIKSKLQLAIKILRQDLQDDETLIARFLREAKAANVVRHDNIVKVFEIDKTAGGIPFIVQELLQGETLSHRLRRKKGDMDAVSIVDLIIPVLDALGEAHAKGVIHRDIKPSNIFLQKKDGQLIPKILDFGISKIATEEDDAQLTQTRALLGSPAYMSPEQIQTSNKVTPRSDVWSVGVMLYELLSGILPFRAENSSAILVKVCTEDPVSLTEAVPGIATGLVNIVSCCMQRNPMERFSDAREVAHALRIVRKKEFRSVTITDPETSNTAGESKAVFPGSDAAPLVMKNYRVSSQTQLELKETEPGKRKRDSSAMYVEKSGADIPTVLSALMIIIVMLGCSLYFNTGGVLPESSYSTERLLFQLAIATIAWYLAIVTMRFTADYLPFGVMSGAIGLLIFSAGFIMLSLAQIISSHFFISAAGILMILSVTITALGFATSGFAVVRDDFSGAHKHIAQGITLLFFSLIALAIGLKSAMSVISAVL